MYRKQFQSFKVIQKPVLYLQESNVRTTTWHFLSTTEHTVVVPVIAHHKFLILEKSDSILLFFYEKKGLSYDSICSYPMT